MEVKGNQPDPPLLERRLVVFTGKGGVGKTVVSSSFALMAARRGLRVLLGEVRSPRRAPALLGLTAHKNGPQTLAPGLTWMNFTPDAALETYAMKLLRFKSVYRAVFEQRAVRRFLRAVPALSEILILGHLVHLLTEHDAYDLAVLDAPSSGSGAIMLQAPQDAMDGAPPGALYDGAAWIQQLLSDARRCAVNLVVLPEELPVSEAIFLYHRIRDEMRLPLGSVFVNRVLSDPFTGLQAPAGDVDEVCRALRATHIGRGLGEACYLLRARLHHQQTYLDRLQAGVPLPWIEIPEMFGAAADEPVSRLAALLDTALRENP